MHILGPHITFIADDEKSLNQCLAVYFNAVGKKGPGNKRLGKRELYADLVKYFLVLKQHGVTLPRNKSLSKRAFQFGLGVILRCHKYTNLSDVLLLKSGLQRNKIAANMDRIFSRVADSVENTPA